MWRMVYFIVIGICSSNKFGPCFCNINFICHLFVHLLKWRVDGEETRVRGLD